MQEFKIIDERRYPLMVESINPNTGLPMKDMNPTWRWEHRITIGYNGKRYIGFVDSLNNKAYIEDSTSGDLKIIEDDSLYESLLNFINQEGYLNIMTPLLKNKDSRFI